jgi:hypothetical protein
MRDKWNAYHVKMEKMKIESRIAENRRRRRPAQETVDLAAEEYDEEIDRLNAVAESLDQTDAEYRDKVERLVQIIDNQRRRIVQHLMGNDESNEAD